jgi:hypothetical protein
MNDDFDREKIKNLALEMAQVMHDKMKDGDFYSGEVLAAVEGIYRGVLMTAFPGDDGIFAMRDHLESFKSGCLDAANGDMSEFELVE